MVVATDCVRTAWLLKLLGSINHALAASHDFFQTNFQQAVRKMQVVMQGLRDVRQQYAAGSGLYILINGPPQLFVAENMMCLIHDDECIVAALLLINRFRADVVVLYRRDAGADAKGLG